MEILTTNFTSIADGQTGAQVATTLNNSLGVVYGAVRYRFNQSDVQTETISGVVKNFISITHGKNTKNVIAELHDSQGVKQNIDGLFSITNANSWRLDINATLTETFELVVNYLAKES